MLPLFLKKTHHFSLVFALYLLMPVNRGQAVENAPVSLRIDTTHPIATFLPETAFGAGLDGLEESELEQSYRPANIKVMAEAPYHRLSYRLRTELGVEAWHWNEEGSWSDPEKKQGYWVSNDTTSKPLLRSYGYRLPRRGNTIDQAVNDSYSRLDDGDMKTFWKSNPYLDVHYTGMDNARYPQWVLIELDDRVPIDAIKILWGEPYATFFEVQYWDGKSPVYLNELTEGVWKTFAGGTVNDGKGGETTLRLGDGAPVVTQYIRLRMLESSGTGPKSDDIRDRLGFAIREIFVGTFSATGKFRDAIKHVPTSKQTNIVVSSTDPWHRAQDRNPGTTQPGFDRILSSGLGRGKAILMPAPVLYDTPENVAAEIRYLKKRGVPVNQIELGEEPDGQIVQPEHYAALYLQFAKVVHAVNPELITGGPGFQSEVNGWTTIIDDQGEHSWMKRFLAYLRMHDRLRDFGFFSFEWYPFDDICQPPAEQLVKHGPMLRHAIDRLQQEGVPVDIPWIVSEYGYSSFAGRVEMELPAALLNVEIVAQFLQYGGTTAYYYGLEPKSPIKELNCTPKDRLWGDLAMFEADEGIVKWRLPVYHGTKMLVEEWAEPTNAPHQMYPVEVRQSDKPCATVAAYALQRPDQKWAVLLLNKNTSPVTLNRVQLDIPKSIDSLPVNETVNVVQYSSKQYVWHPDGENGYPARSNPPERFNVHKDGDALSLVLPPMSISVLCSTTPLSVKSAQVTTEAQVENLSTISNH